MNRRGSAWLVLLILVVLVAGVALTLGSRRGRHEDSSEAEVERIAEIGLARVSRALWIYHEDQTYPWEQILLDHVSLSTDAQEGGRVELSSTNAAPLRGDPAHFLGVPVRCGSGAFVAVVRDNDDGDGNATRDRDGRVIVHITAFHPLGPRYRIEALLRFDPGVSSLRVDRRRRL